MNERAIKEKILQDIMDLMDEREMGSMKSKSPKFMKLEVETSDPKLTDDLKIKMLETADKSEPQEDEKPDEESLDHNDRMDDKLSELPSNDMEDEDLERLKEMYARLK